MLCMQMSVQPAWCAALGGAVLTSLARSMSCRILETEARVSLATCRVALRVALSRDSSCFRCWRQ